VGTVSAGHRCAPDATADDERHTIARAQQGDEAACRAIVERHQRRVLSQLRGVLVPSGRGAVAEDLAQETFLRAFRALPRFMVDERTNLGAWLVTIATRVALNELRRRGPAQARLDSIVEAFPASSRPDLEAPIFGRAVARALAELAPAYRAAFLLRELHGLDYAEIATALSIDLGTVKSRLSRARARLRELLEEVDDDRRPVR
jgi:RNA polymerase sigma-70 factor (ECF subfamily)